MLKNKEAPEMEKEDDMEEGSEMEGGEKDYQAECDATDIMRAAEVKADPARYKAALSILQKKKAAIESIEDLKAAKKKAFTKED